MNEAFSFHGYSMNNHISCVVDGEDIFQINYMTGQKIPIGKTVSAYSELEQTTKEYYDKLVELQVIVPPADPQETMVQMQATMQSMAAMIKTLSDEMKELRNNGNGADRLDGGENVSQHKHKRGLSESAGTDGGNT